LQSSANFALVFSATVVSVASLKDTMQWLELKIPPVGVALIAAGMMWLTARALPSLSVPITHRAIFAGCVFLFGIVLGILGIVSFRRANTSVHPMKLELTSSLVTGGIYRISRNPMYLGIAVALFGCGIYLSNVVALAFVAVFIWYMNRFQILPEERNLERQFGEQFTSEEKGDIQSS
jgi:protein-S-isoprenylcysteine O-methyltransferase Ste14